MARRHEAEYPQHVDARPAPPASLGGRPLTALGMQMRDALPPVLRRSNDYLAVIHACARETDRLEQTIEQTRRQFDPASADLLLNAWETIVRLPVGGQGATVAQRQAKVELRLRKLIGTSEGREWEDQITEMIGQGWSYQEHDPADPTSPAPYTLKITLPFPPAGSAYADALAQIRDVTPAHLALTLDSGTGFVLDESELDIEAIN